MPLGCRLLMGVHFLLLEGVFLLQQVGAPELLNPWDIKALHGV